MPNYPATGTVPVARRIFMPWRWKRRTWVAAFSLLGLWYVLSAVPAYRLARHYHMKHNIVEVWQTVEIIYKPALRIGQSSSPGRLILKWENRLMDWILGPESDETKATMGRPFG